MSHNDPDNLRIDGSGMAVLTCDYGPCGEVFTREPDVARRQMQRNGGGRIYCSKTCAARAANDAKSSRRPGRAKVHTACLLHPDAIECPLMTTPPLHTADLRRGAFQPQTDTELDLCIEFVRATAELRQYAPPADSDTPWNPDHRVVWERADATHDVVSRLLDREVSRRKK